MLKICKNPVCGKEFKGRKKRKFCSHVCQMRETHCVNGHEFTPENTIVRSNGRRKCRECNKAYLHARRMKRKALGIKTESEYNKHYQLRFCYKMSLADYQKRLEEQGNKCANPFCDATAASVRYQRLMVDHDHKCCAGRTSCGKCVRGLLCSKCNSALGHAKDSIVRLQGLISYLEKYERRS